MQSSTSRYNEAHSANIEAQQRRDRQRNKTSAAELAH